jgi:hypothetical protein
MKYRVFLLLLIICILSLRVEASCCNYIGNVASAGNRILCDLNEYKVGTREQSVDYYYNTAQQYPSFINKIVFKKLGNFRKIKFKLLSSDPQSVNRYSVNDIDFQCILQNGTCIDHWQLTIVGATFDIAYLTNNKPRQLAFRLLSFRHHLIFWKNKHMMGQAFTMSRYNLFAKSFAALKVISPIFTIYKEVSNFKLLVNFLSYFNYVDMFNNLELSFSNIKVCRFLKNLVEGNFKA